MTSFESLVLALAIIALSLCAGYAARRICEKNWPALGEKLDVWRKGMQGLAIFGLLPFSAALSLWGLPKPSPELLALPLLGLASYVWGGALALALARPLKLDRRQRGAFYCCGSFTNIGAVGGLVCLLYLGENSIALVALYRLLEEAWYFSVAIPVSRWHGAGENGARLKISDFRFNPSLLAILLALACGLALNLAGTSRPGICGPLASAAMLLATVLFLFAIGLSLRFSRLGLYWRPALAMCAIKFLGSPLLIASLAALAGFGSLEGGLPLKTVVILSAMPVAMTALGPPSLFDLDLDLANACWIFSTVGLIFALPALMLVLPFI